MPLFLDQSHRLCGNRRIDPNQEVGESFEIGKRPSRKLSLAKIRLSAS